jgi:hypothetical protein
MYQQHERSEFPGIISAASISKPLNRRYAERKNLTVWVKTSRGIDLSGKNRFLCVSTRQSGTQQRRVKGGNLLCANHRTVRPKRDQKDMEQESDAESPREWGSQPQKCHSLKAFLAGGAKRNLRRLTTPPAAW